jgi:hypothetical protein
MQRKATFTQRSAATSLHALEKRAGQNLMINFSCQRRLRAAVVPQSALQQAALAAAAKALH